MTARALSHPPATSPPMANALAHAGLARGHVAFQTSRRPALAPGVAAAAAPQRRRRQRQCGGALVRAAKELEEIDPMTGGWCPLGMVGQCCTCVPQVGCGQAAAPLSCTPQPQHVKRLPLHTPSPRRRGDHRHHHGGRGGGAGGGGRPDMGVPPRRRQPRPGHGRQAARAVPAWPGLPVLRLPHHRQSAGRGRARGHRRRLAGARRQQQARARQRL